MSLVLFVQRKNAVNTCRQLTARFTEPLGIVSSMNVIHTCI